MSLRCRASALFVCLTLLAAEPPVTTPKEKPALVPGEVKQLPARPFVRLGTRRLQRERGVETVTCLAFTADGKSLASGSVDRTLHLWDMASGRQLRRFAGHMDTIEAAALSPTGRFLASSGRDKMLRLWDASTGRELHCLDAPANSALSLSFLPDEKTLQWWGWIGNIHRYDVASGKRIGTVRSRRSLFHSAALGSGGLVAPSGFAESEDADWPDELLPSELRKKLDTEEGRLEQRFRHIRVSADGRMAAIVETTSLGGLEGSKCRIRVWELATGGLIADLGETNGTSCLFVFSLNGWGLFTSGESRLRAWRQSVRGWDLSARKPVHRFQAPLGEASCLTVSPDGTKLAAGSDDAMVYVWDIDGLFQPLPALPLSNEELEHNADRLHHDNASAAYRAMYRLACRPEQAVPFLHERWRKRMPTTTQFRQLIADLDANEFAVREKATETLERMGSSIESALRRVQENPPSLEVRLRVKALLEKLSDNGRRKRDALEVLRSISVLERIGTAKARAALRDLAKNLPDSNEGLEAEAALQRLVPQSIR